MSLMMNRSGADVAESSPSADGDAVGGFWSREQLMMIESVPHAVHIVLGLVVSLIGCLGFAANATVLIIFSRFRRLRTPANIFIINLAVSDMGACVLHSLAAYSNFNGRWAFGAVCCQLYGLSIGLFGLVSILTFSAIAVERCLVITSSPLGLSKWKITRSRAHKICILIWLHCGNLVVLPFFGMSAYVPEGLYTTCSWDYTTRTPANRAYYIVLLTTGFILPVCLICISYARITASVLHHARQMVTVRQENSSSSGGVLRKLRRQTEIRTAHIVVILILVYLTAWTPYAIVTCIGQFGPEGYLTPYVTAIPAYFAKTAVVIDPLVYGFSHPHFRTSFLHYMASFTQETQQGDLVSAQHQSYQSKNLTIYPSGTDISRDKQRRMLRTFRNMSVERNVSRAAVSAASAAPLSSAVVASSGPVLELSNPGHAAAQLAGINTAAVATAHCDACDKF